MRIKEFVEVLRDGASRATTMTGRSEVLRRLPPWASPRASSGRRSCGSRTIRGSDIWRPRSRPGRAVASRFVAGETLAEAMAAARDLDRRRHRRDARPPRRERRRRRATRSTRGRRTSRRSARDRRRRPTLDCAISVKLTQLGLDDRSTTCLANLEPILDAADEAGARRDDRHGGPRLRRPHARGRSARRTPATRSVGVALQSYLRRTADDLFALPAGHAASGW